MGLADMTVEEFQKMKDFLKFLQTFGITEEHLKEIPKMVDRFKNSDTTLNNYVRKTDAEKQKQELENSLKAKPEDIVKMFSEDVEEFYPDGRR